MEWKRVSVDGYPDSSRKVLTLDTKPGGHVMFDVMAGVELAMRNRNCKEQAPIEYWLDITAELPVRFSRRSMSWVELKRRLNDD